MRGTPSIFVFDGAGGLDSGLGYGHPPQRLQPASPRDHIGMGVPLGACIESAGRPVRVFQL